ncbi:MAG: 1-(5-phosphoribosyl)-5-[(5-phosphoribosylamino)methylideneamino]imidazole-4-carboxamide isomerase [Amphiplicatus sp.]
MTLYPAIDLKGGRCVRLLHGKMDAATVYHDDPGAQAAAFAGMGFDRLHIVDLDGAFAGRAENAAAVEAILKASAAKKQLGGGIRSLAAIEAWLEKGIDRVILGTAAVSAPDLVKEAGRRFPGRIAVGIDALEGRVKTHGWAGEGGLAALDLARRFEDAGVAAIVYTDIGRDGALTGVNVTATAALAAAVGIPVIASGGVAGKADIAALAAEAKIEGAILGRALYERRLAPEEAFAAARR